MTIAMIMSKNRLVQEHAMLNRLVVGLLDDGNNVIRVVPEIGLEEVPTLEMSVSFAQRIETTMPCSRLLRRNRRDKMVEIFQKNDVTTVVVFGKDALQLALDVAKEFDVQVMCEVVSMRDARRVKKGRKIWRWFAATPSIEQEIARRVGSDRVALVPLGVSNLNAKKITDSAISKSIVVLDASSDLKNTIEILNSLKSFQNLHIFLEMTGTSQQRLWKQISQLQMHDRVTCLRDVAGLRPLIVQTDLVVLPSKSMQVRTVLLEAMLCEIPILATQIPGFDMLVDEETAIIVDDSWEDGLSLVLDGEEIAGRIGENGSLLIKQKYGSAVQISAFETSFALI